MVGAGNVVNGVAGWPAVVASGERGATARDGARGTAFACDTVKI